MNKNKMFEKLDELYNKTLESDLKFDGKLNNIDFFSLLCKATSNNQMIKFRNSNLCMFNYKYEKQDSILMIFSIPLSDNSDDNKKQNKSKHITERIMDIIKILEEYFITLDYTDCKQIKEERFSYLTVIKKINKKQIEEEK